MKIEVRYKGPGRYETAIAEREDPGATFKLRTHASVAEVDAAIRADIERAQAWKRVKLPILMEGPAGPESEIPQELRDVVLAITAEAEAKAGAG